MKELWKDIKNYEGFYQISDKGSFRSLDRRVFLREGVFSNLKGKTTVGGKTNKKGYLRAVVSKGGKTKTFSRHRLVAEAFIPNPEGKDTVNHKNGIKTDNRVETWNGCP